MLKPCCGAACKNLQLSLTWQRNDGCRAAPQPLIMYKNHEAMKSWDWLAATTRHPQSTPPSQWLSLPKHARSPSLAEPSGLSHWPPLLSHSLRAHTANKPASPIPVTTAPPVLHAAARAACWPGCPQRGPGRTVCGPSGCPLCQSSAQRAGTRACVCVVLEIQRPGSPMPQGGALSVWPWHRVGCATRAIIRADPDNRAPCPQPAMGPGGCLPTHPRKRTFRQLNSYCRYLASSCAWTRLVVSAPKNSRRMMSSKVSLPSPMMTWVGLRTVKGRWGEEGCRRGCVGVRADEVRRG